MLSTSVLQINQKARTESQDGKLGSVCLRQWYSTRLTSDVIFSCTNKWFLTFSGPVAYSER